MSNTTKFRPATESDASERALLGAVMLWPDLICQASARLEPADFARPDHRKIFQVMIERTSRGEPVDRIAIGEFFRQAGELESIGGWAYLEEISTPYKTLKHIAGFIDEIIKSSRLHNLSMVLERATAMTADHGDPDAVIGELEQDLIDNMEHGSDTRSEPLEVSAQKAYEEIISIKRTAGECIGLPSGIAELDRETTGLRDGEVTIIGARPGQGKTWLMCQLARINCKRGKKVGIFSIEMRRRQLLHRLACQESGVSFDRIRDPRFLNPVDELRLGDAYAEISKWPLEIDDASSLRRDQLTARARLMVRKGADLIMLDYLQRIQSERGEKLFEAVTEHSLAIAGLAKSINRPVVALSQLKRNGDEEPTLEDLRQSGQIEQDADMVWLIHRPKEEGHWTHKDKIIVAKNRSGVDGQFIRTVFDGEHGQFRPGEW